MILKQKLDIQEIFLFWLIKMNRIQYYLTYRSSSFFEQIIKLKILFLTVIQSKQPMHLKSRHRQKYSEQIQRRVNRQPQVRTVEIFINNLDNHIAQSYEKLRRSKQKDSSQKKISHHNDGGCEDTLFRDGSTMFQNSSRYIGASIKKDDSEMDSILSDSKCQKNIVFLNNREVNEYINYVYDMYNIPDPLGETKKLKTSFQSQKSLNLVKTPSVRKRSSASELKDKIVLQRDIDLTPFNAYSNKKDDAGYDFSLRTERSKQKSKDLRSTGWKSKNVDAIPQTIKLNSQKHVKKLSVAIQREIPQVFRYCLACEEAVLEDNLRYHESICKQLQEMFHKSLEDLVEHLDQKIKRISRSIQTQFVEASNEKWLSEFKSLKKSVGEWVNDVQNMTNKQNTAINSARRKMSEIQESWGRTVSSRFDELAKLHWFGRLRQNIRRTYNI